MNKKKFSIDASLAKRVASGDEEALRIFYGRYADPLFAFIYHHLNSVTQDAEEIWQTTLLAAMQSLPSFGGKSRLFTWLCAIARHKIADFLRRGGHSADSFSDLPNPRLAELIATAPLPEEILLQRSTRVLVIRALANLPDDYRSALLARYIDERPVSEISVMLGRSYKATESLLSRARASLRHALEVLEDENNDN